METRTLEHRMGDWARRHLPTGLSPLILFGLKQAWSCLFGAMLLLGLLVSKAIWQDGWHLARYDALFIYAISLQALFLAAGFETWREARVILLFHATGTLMELFKTHMGSWTYPEENLLRLGGVPLFSGFMYASVGSYMARVIRVFEMRFADHPPFWASALLASMIYLNFFTHHYMADLRLFLIAATLVLFARTRIWFRVGNGDYWMPLPLAAALTSLFLWCAEMIGTGTGTWLYAGQRPWDWVSLSKMGSWYMLLYVSFATVTLVCRDALEIRPFKRYRATTGR